VDDTTDGGAAVGPDPTVEIMEIGSRSPEVEETWVNKKEENETPYRRRPPTASSSGGRVKVVEGVVVLWEVSGWPPESAQATEEAGHGELIFRNVLLTDSC
jgi:hypothetical protein